MAVRLRDHNTAQILVKAGENINIRDANGETPFHVAVKSNLFEMVKFFVQSGAEVNLCDNYGRTPLHMAIERGLYIVADFLVKSGAEVNLKDINGVTPLHLAVNGGYFYAMELLLKSGADVDLTDNDEISPFRMAIEKCLNRIAELLIKSGAKVNVKCENGGTLLHVAVQKSCYGIVNLLIKAGLEIDVRNDNGETPLYIAVVADNDKIVKLLVQSGARLDFFDGNGDSLLCVAVKKGLDRMVKFLVNSGAVVAITDAIIKNRTSDSAAIFTQKFIMFKDICKNKDLKYTIKYVQLYFPEIEIVEYVDHDLSIYRKEIDRMKTELISPNCKISVYKFLLEEDPDIVASYVSNVKTKSFTYVRRFYRKNYAQYSSMILDKLLAAKKRHLLLLKFNIVMDHSDLYDLPYPARRNLTKYLSNLDLEKFVTCALEENL